MKQSIGLPLTLLLFGAPQANAQQAQFSWYARCYGELTNALPGTCITNTLLPDIGTLAVPTRGVLPFDWDLDGDQDILLLGDSGTTIADLRLLQNETARTDPNDPNTDFNEFTDMSGQILLPFANFKDGALGDFDLDGDLDVALVENHATGGNFYVLNNAQSGSPSRMLRDGLGTSWLYGATGVFTSIVAGDFDGDGDDDLLLGEASNGSSGGGLRLVTTSQLTTIDDTTYTVVMSPSVVAGWNGASVRDLAAGDFDGDGDLDIAIAASTTSAPVHSIGLNDGSGGFTFTNLTATATGNPSTVEAADLDADGDIDVVYGHEANPSGSTFIDGQLEIFDNNGSGSFMAGGAFGTTGYITDIVAGDVDEDGLVEILSSARRYGGSGNIIEGRTRMYERPAIGQPYAEVSFRIDDDTFVPGTVGIVGVTPQPSNGGALALFDSDLDLDLDLFVAHGGLTEFGLFTNRLWQLEALQLQSQALNSSLMEYELSMEFGLGNPASQALCVLGVSFTPPVHIFPSSAAGTLTGGTSWILSDTFAIPSTGIFLLPIGSAPTGMIDLYAQAAIVSLNRNETRFTSVTRTKLGQ